MLLLSQVEEAATAAAAATSATPGPPTSTGCLRVPVANLTKIEFRNMLAKKKMYKKEPAKDYKKTTAPKMKQNNTSWQIEKHFSGKNGNNNHENDSVKPANATTIAAAAAAAEATKTNANKMAAVKVRKTRGKLFEQQGAAAAKELSERSSNTTTATVFSAAIIARRVCVCE